MKTNSLRKLIKELLEPVAPTAYRIAPAQNIYPHIVYELDNTNLDDMSRDDIRLEVHVWNRDKPADTEDMADRIEQILHNKNLPQSDILPTFYREGRTVADDEDKRINHIVLTFEAQCYERKE